MVAKLGEVIEAVHGEGALAGVHCCGNTEWSILMDAGVDIMNFDAFDYGETIAALSRGGEGAPESGQGAGLWESCPPTAPKSRRRRWNPDGQVLTPWWKTWPRRPGWTAS